MIFDRLLKTLKSAVLFGVLVILVAPFTVQTGFTCSSSPIYEFEYLSFEAFRTPIKGEAPKPIQVPGNIVVYQNYLIVVDKDSGIHIIDNTDKSSPNPLSFIPVYAASQISVVDDFLYVKSLMDLIVIDISNPETATEINRLEFFYPYDTPETAGGGSSSMIGTAHPEHGIVERVTITGYSSGSCGSYGSCSFGFAGSESDPGGSGGNGGSGSGTNGSMSATIIVGDYLYALGRTAHAASLISVSLADPVNPVEVSSVTTERRSETLYYHDNAVYVGTEVGVFIYDVSAPGYPDFAGSIAHEWQCDPVVVDGDWAYATLRSERRCGGSRNELNVLDVTDIKSPTLAARVDLYHPHGLAIEGDYLFIAEGFGGVKVFSVADPLNPLLITTITPVYATDIIVKDGWGVVVGRDGILQFDYSDLNDIKVISSL